MSLVLANKDSVIDIESSSSSSDSIYQRSSSSKPELDTIDTATTSGSKVSFSKCYIAFYSSLMKVDKL